MVNNIRTYENDGRWHKITTNFEKEYESARKSIVAKNIKIGESFTFKKYNC